MVDYVDDLPAKGPADRSEVQREQLSRSVFASNSELRGGNSHITSNSKASMLQNDTTKDIRSHLSRNVRVHPFDPANETKN